MGWKDGAEDVRLFRRWCLEGKVTPVPSLLLASAIGEARTVSDVAGNSKLAKGTEGGVGCERETTQQQRVSLAWALQHVGSSSRAVCAPWGWRKFNTLHCKEFPSVLAQRQHPRSQDMDTS